MRGTGARLVIGWAACTVAAVVVARGAVALPEHCGTAEPAKVDAAIRLAVGWLADNQQPDGTWLYRYEADTDRDLGGYNWVRHAGVLLSLYQAAHAGEPGALAVADRGRAVATGRQLVGGDDWASLVDGSQATTGGTALLVAALVERRDATADTSDDGLLRRLGAHLARQTTPTGAVWEQAGLDGTPVPGTEAPFTTGEAFFALARLHRIFPGEGWDAPALRIARYIVTERADAEGFVPDMSDHWGAYGFAELRRWPQRAATGLTADELGFAREQLGLMSIQTRYETQRTNGGVSRWLRGRQALGAAIGTIGEAMGQWWSVTALEPRLAHHRAGLRERIACMAGAMVERQVDDAEAARYPRPALVRGAFFQFGITQMDDQQHTLSALLAARTALDDPTPLPRRSPIPTNLLLLALAVVTALSPLRLAAGAAGDRLHRVRQVGLAAAAVTAVMGVLAAVGGPLVRALDVSAANALIAAGLTLTASGLYALGRPDEAFPGRVLTPLLVPLGLRPDVMLLAVAVGAGGRGWAFTGFVALAMALAVAATVPRPGPVVQRWVLRLTATVATATALALVVDGVYAI